MDCFCYVPVSLFESLVNEGFPFVRWLFHVHMIDDRVPPWSPPGKVVLYLDYIDEEPRPPRDPVERTWDIPAFVDDIGLRPEQRTPVVVVIGIPIAGPPIPVAVIRMMDDGKIARPRLKKHKAHITYIEAVLSLGHDMHLHRVVFHVAAARDNNGFRVQFGSEPASPTTA